MAALERTYTIPLRKEWLKSPKYRRAKKAVNAVKQFLIKHMKSEDIRLGKYLNENIWKHGIKNPPGKIKVNVQKDDKNVVRAELFGKKIDLGEKKAEGKQGIASKVAEKITGKKAVKKAKKTEKKEAAETEQKAKKEENPSETAAEKKQETKETEKKPEAKEEKTEKKTEEKKETKEAPKEEKEKSVEAPNAEEKSKDAKQKPAEK